MGSVECDGGNMFCAIAVNPQIIFFIYFKI